MVGEKEVGYEKIRRLSARGPYSQRHHEPEHPGMPGRAHPRWAILGCQAASGARTLDPAERRRSAPPRPAPRLAAASPRRRRSSTRGSGAHDLAARRLSHCDTQPHGHPHARPRPPWRSRCYGPWRGGPASMATMPRPYPCGRRPFDAPPPPSGRGGPGPGNRPTSRKGATRGGAGPARSAGRRDERSRRASPRARPLLR